MRWAWTVMFLLGCGGAKQTRAVPSSGEVHVRTQTGKYDVVVHFEPSPPPMGELFEAVALVKDGLTGAPVTSALVTLDARMPQHEHGMMTAPKPLPGACPEGTPLADQAACPHPDGIYRVEGFKWHMAGDWTVSVAVKGPKGYDTTTFLYNLPPGR